MSGTPSTATDCHAAVHKIANGPTMDVDASFAIVFTGHDICTHGAMGTKPHEDCRGIRITSNEKEWCIVQSRGSLDKELRTLIHEIGHIYKAPDHYGDPNTKVANEMIGDESCSNKKQYLPAEAGVEYNENCLYGEKRSSVANYAMCAGCRYKINQKLNSPTT